ncbi:hypothetical protein ACMFMG_003970 [Clarireedia jacksonii]
MVNGGASYDFLWSSDHSGASEAASLSIPSCEERKRKGEVETAYRQGTWGNNEMEWDIFAFFSLLLTSYSRATTVCSRYHFWLDTHTISDSIHIPLLARYTYIFSSVDTLHLGVYLSLSS